MFYAFICHTQGCAHARQRPRPRTHTHTRATHAHTRERARAHTHARVIVRPAAFRGGGEASGRQGWGDVSQRTRVRRERDTSPHVLDFLNWSQMCMCKVLQTCMHAQSANLHAMRAIGAKEMLRESAHFVAVPQKNIVPCAFLLYCTRT